LLASRITDRLRDGYGLVAPCTSSGATSSTKLDAEMLPCEYEAARSASAPPDGDEAATRD
jgi:hypothetical protein